MAYTKSNLHARVRGNSSKLRNRNTNKWRNSIVHMKRNVETIVAAAVACLALTNTQNRMLSTRSPCKDCVETAHKTPSNTDIHNDETKKKNLVSSQQQQQYSQVNTQTTLRTCTQHNHRMKDLNYFYHLFWCRLWT